MARAQRRVIAGFGLAALAALFAACAALGPEREPVPVALPAATPAPEPELREFEATAYSIEGETAAGTRAREGICAADPDVIPLGSRIRIHGAGEYSGECQVEDTGRAIRGREIDIYLSSDAEAKRFGRQTVRVEILERG